MVPAASGQATEAADHVEVSSLTETGENKHVFPTTEDRSSVDAADVVGKVIKVTPDRRARAGRTLPAE